MSNVMFAQMGLSLVGSWGDYQSASIEADLAGKIQNYRNAMGKLSAARAENAVTVNEARVQDANMENQFLLQRTALQDQAKQEVQAAAAGVTGGSVALAARDLKASAGRASYAQRRNMHQKKAELSAQKTTIAINAITGQDTQVIPQPSIGSMLLGAGTNLLNIYDSHQPPGERILE